MAAGLALEVDLLSAPFFLHPTPRLLIDQQCDLDRRARLAAQDAPPRATVLGHAERRGDGLALAEQRGRFDAVDLEMAAPRLEVSMAPLSRASSAASVNASTSWSDSWTGGNGGAWTKA